MLSLMRVAPLPAERTCAERLPGHRIRLIMRFSSTFYVAIPLPVLSVIFASPLARAGDYPPLFARPLVAVATVTTVSSHAATHGCPPHVELDVNCVVRGELHVMQVRANWDPPSHDIDTTGREAEMRAWLQTPMENPHVGQTYILFGELISQDENGCPTLYLDARGTEQFSSTTFRDVCAYLDEYDEWHRLELEFHAAHSKQRD